MRDIGERYDYERVLGLSLRIVATKMFGIVKHKDKTVLDQSKSNICSDLIAYILMNLCPTFKNLIKKHFKKLDVSQYSSFPPDDFWVSVCLTSFE